MTKLTDKLTSLLETALDGGSPGAMLALEGPGVDARVAVGKFAAGRPRPLAVTDGFRMASMSKTFTATLITLLAERGELDVDAPFEHYLAVDNMLVAEGHRSEEITVRHLLNHTAGLWDFAMSRDWAIRIVKNPGVYRHPRETLDWALDHGSTVGAPGERHYYSDTGYVLLGLIIEAVTGSAWGDLCRRHIFTPAGMTETWLEGYESPRSTLSHTYVDGVNGTDGLVIHGSVDWAAGGHVSTLTDLSRFLRGLAAGMYFERSETFATMLEGAPTELGRYGAGLSIRQLGGGEAWGHGGFWGSSMFYLPEHDTTIVGTVNRTGGNMGEIVEAAAELLR